MYCKFNCKLSWIPKWFWVFSVVHYSRVPFPLSWFTTWIESHTSDVFSQYQAAMFNCLLYTVLCIVQHTLKYWFLLFCYKSTFVTNLLTFLHKISSSQNPLVYKNVFFFFFQAPQLQARTVQGVAGWKSGFYKIPFDNQMDLDISCSIWH